MFDDNPLIPLGKAANTLVARVFDTIGMVYEPTHVRRMARAKRDAALLEAEGSLKAELLTQGFLREQRLYEQNRQSITERALSQLEESAAPDGMEDDWILNFFDKCRVISVESSLMDRCRHYGGRILAGEANQPGSYSTRAVNSLSSMDKREANLFTSLCGFCWTFDDVNSPIIHDINANVYNDVGLDFLALQHLDDVGLINFNELSRFEKRDLPNSVDMSYFGRKLTLEHQRSGRYSLRIGAVILTETGRQLEPICGSEPVDGFWEYMCAKWMDNFRFVAACEKH